MSIIRIIEGEYKTYIEGDWIVYTDEFEAYAEQGSYFTSDEGTVFGNPEKEEEKKSMYFKNAWWSDQQGNKITQARIGEIVNFHIETQDIPDKDPITGLDSKIYIRLYDYDDDQMHDYISIVQDNIPMVSVEVKNNKAIVPGLTLAPGLMEVKESPSDDVRLFFECIYEEDFLIPLPKEKENYLLIKSCYSEEIESYKSRGYGRCDFYRFRYDDFMRRHANCGHMPPVYYFGEMRKSSFWEIIDSIKEWWTPSLTEEMKQVSVSLEEVEKEGNKYKPVPSTSYGFKYCVRFTNVLMPKLSPLGKTWLERSRYDLQKYMEQGLIDKRYIATYDIILFDFLEDNFNDNFKPSIYDRIAYSRNPQKLKKIQQQKMDEYYSNIELDNNRFQEFAFATHPDAYDPQKMQVLPLEDLIRIALTPDIKEWFGEGWWMTLKQAILVAANYDLKEIRRIISEFDLEDVKIFLDELWENIFN